MLFGEFFRWWYGAGWSLAIANVKKHLKNTQAQFSVPTLIATLFSPWRRVTTEPGRSLDAHFRAMLDNLISRFVGFGIRILVLLAAAIILFLTVILGGLQIILWPALPPLVIVLIIRGIA
jgi:hypothetical protein